MIPNQPTPIAGVLQNAGNLNLNVFPEPRLQTDEPNDMNRFLWQEGRLMDAKPWRDDTGAIHIPIYQAMQLIAQKGLPVRPGVQQPSASQPPGKIAFSESEKATDAVSTVTGSAPGIPLLCSAANSKAMKENSSMMNRTVRMMKSWALLVALVLFAATSATAQFWSEPSVKGALPPGLSKVGIDQRLNEQVPLDLHFLDEQGNTVRLGDYFHPGRPVIILRWCTYNCPMLCGGRCSTA